MAITVGINGFGRIGRQVYKAVRDHYDDKIDVVAVNDIGNIEIMTHLLKYDTNYGRFPGEVAPTEDGFIANKAIRILRSSAPWTRSSSVATWPRSYPGTTMSGAIRCAWRTWCTTWRSTAWRGDPERE